GRAREYISQGRKPLLARALADTRYVDTTAETEESIGFRQAFADGGGVARFKICEFLELQNDGINLIGTAGYQPDFFDLERVVGGCRQGNCGRSNRAVSIVPNFEMKAPVDLDAKRASTISGKLGCAAIVRLCSNDGSGDRFPTRIRYAA